MENKMSEEQIYEEARKRVKEKRDFLGHFGAYAIVNIILVIVWFLSGKGYPWFLWCLGIWGVFVFWNFLSVFVFERKSETAAIEKEVEKIRRQQE